MAGRNRLHFYSDDAVSDLNELCILGNDRASKRLDFYLTSGFSSTLPAPQEITYVELVACSFNRKLACVSDWF